MEDNRGKTWPTPRNAARVMALPRPWSGGVEWRLLDGRGWLSKAITHEIEQRRLFPWIPACFGIGILLFFQADGAPALWAPLGAFALCGAASVVLRRNMTALIAMIALSAVFAGFSAGVIRTRNVAAPALTRIVITTIAGFIEAVEDREEGQRLLIRVVEMKDVAEAERPRLVRVSVRAGAGLTAGEFVTGTARLLPPPEAAWPGGYDFARDAYYKGIGAVGSTVGQVRRIDPRGRPIGRCGWQPRWTKPAMRLLTASQRPSAARPVVSGQPW
jgi:competence protein ComEC